MGWVLVAYGNVLKRSKKYEKGLERSEKVGKGEASWWLKYIVRLVEESGLFGVSHYWLGDVMSFVKMIELVEGSERS